MPFINGKDMINHAYQNGYGVGAFSAHNAETILGILEAAEEEQSPVMIQVGQKVIQTLGMEAMKNLIDIYEKQFTIPISIHLDHSRTFDQTMQAIQLGFQSVMFDGSALDIDENTDITRTVAKIAKSLNIGSEGEIGKIGGTEDDISIDEKDALITNVNEALTFVEATDVDYLAISIGTAHGLYKQTPSIRFERLNEISSAVQRPIVLHGGSDVPDEQVKKAISLGISKINVDTELRQAFTKGIQNVLETNPDEIVLANSLGSGKEFLKMKVQEKIKVFGSQGKAKEFL
ncbi:class II fructose-bisphosphate aldolase [Mammaliicoccus lentus]|uniref:class II fructose-bisphosphate aldolase n=1 Tax=Mammaliicoccus lentus TaxID=42858 RepID=UPI0027F039BC|nr:class II fructose-bisphosphate aldolase [Mammaliicoccus lentus]MDQ7143605.1 class II fructose-bisphosphate aldolase [Mammaliicoccus lentus]MEB5685396.1 class II fructose-bisphosphate aldolase [Mammaliicoccus lentus]